MHGNVVLGVCLVMLSFCLAFILTHNDNDDKTQIIQVPTLPDLLLL